MSSSPKRTLVVCVIFLGMVLLLVLVSYLPTKTLIEIGSVFTKGILALLVGSGTLLALVSLRNSHLADRTRSSVAEILTLEKNKKEIINSLQALEEIDDLKNAEIYEIDRKIGIIDKQRQIFMARHRATAIVGACIVTMIVLVPLIILADAGDQYIRLRLIAGITALVSYIFYAGCAIMLMIEFIIATATLAENNKLLEKLENGQQKT